MRSIFFLAIAMVVMGLAFWAYRENYRTQDALNEMERVQGNIANLREQLVVLRAEWAYLNRPGRLRELVNMNFDKLKLLPFGADQFVDVGQVAFASPKPAMPAPGTETAAIERPAWYPPRRPQESTP